MLGLWVKMGTDVYLEVLSNAVQDEIYFTSTPDPVEKNRLAV